MLSSQLAALQSIQSQHAAVSSENVQLREMLLQQEAEIDKLKVQLLPCCGCSAAAACLAVHPICTPQTCTLCVLHQAAMPHSYTAAWRCTAARTLGTLPAHSVFWTVHSCSGVMPAPAALVGFGVGTVGTACGVRRCQRCGASTQKRSATHFVQKAVAEGISNVEDATGMDGKAGQCASNDLHTCTGGHLVVDDADASADEAALSPKLDRTQMTHAGATAKLNALVKEMAALLQKHGLPTTHFTCAAPLTLSTAPLSSISCAAPLSAWRTSRALLQSLPHTALLSPLPSWLSSLPCRDPPHSRLCPARKVRACEHAACAGAGTLGTRTQHL
jgi:hypothetical protein